MTPLKLFMSYRSTDSAQVDTIASRLASIRDKGNENEPLYAPWQDKYGILGGQDWWQAIVDAIIACDVFVFHLSREALKSDVCKAELSYAYKRNRFVIPVVLEGEYTYNTTTGKNDISYWNDLPSELKDNRIQFIFYQGSSFYADFARAIAQYRSNAAVWQDIDSPRPPDPRAGSENDANARTLYAKAVDLADHLDFETAIRLLRKVINLGDPAFTSTAYEWIHILNQYKQLIETDSYASTRFQMPHLWTAYKTLFPKPFLQGLYKDNIFDPKDFASRDFRVAPPTEPAPVAVVAVPNSAASSTPAALPPMTEKEAFDATIAFLVPLMGRGSERQATVEAALLGCRVLQQINWDGPAQTFTIHLVMTLRKFGHCSKDNPAIVMLLRAMKDYVGDDQYPQIDRLIAHYNAPKA